MNEQHFRCLDIVFLHDSQILTEGAAFVHSHFLDHKSTAAAIQDPQKHNSGEVH